VILEAKVEISPEAMKRPSGICGGAELRRKLGRLLSDLGPEATVAYAMV
jgi:hypothetical protein